MKEKEKKTPLMELVDKEEVSGDEFLEAFLHSARYGLRFKCKEVLDVFERVDLDYMQLARIQEASIRALIRIRDHKRLGLYPEKLPRMHDYRWIRNTAQILFDKSINRED